MATCTKIHPGMNVAVPLDCNPAEAEQGNLTGKGTDWNSARVLTSCGNGIAHGQCTSSVSCWNVRVITHGALGVSSEGEEHMFGDPSFCDRDEQRWQGFPSEHPRDYPPVAEHVRPPLHDDKRDHRPDPSAKETRRRGYNDIRQERHLLPGQLTLALPPQTYRVWLAKVERIIRNQLGPSWMDGSGFESGEMAECAIDAIESAFHHRTQVKNTQSDAGWCFEAIIAWIDGPRPVQVHSEETDTRRQLLAGMFQHGNLSVSGYWANII